MNVFKSRYLFSILFVLLITLPVLGQEQPFGISGNKQGALDKVSVDVIHGQDTVQAGSELRFAVAMDIDEGWHLNAHNPPLDYLIGVSLDISTSNQAMVSNIQYPNPLQKQFSFADEVLDVYEGSSHVVLKAQTGSNLTPGSYRLDGELTIQACSDQVCLPPSTVELEFPFIIGSEDAPSNTKLFDKLDENRSSVSQSGNQIASMFNNQGYIWAFFSIFLIGLALNLTPCVCPMMSVTVSLFGGNEDRNMASTFSKPLIYVLGIIFMYSALGVMAAYTGELFGSWLQSPLVLGGIGGLILLLSLSMFGLYELQPPSWMMQKLGKTQ